MEFLAQGWEIYVPLRCNKEPEFARTYTMNPDFAHCSHCLHCCSRLGNQIVRQTRIVHRISMPLFLGVGFRIVERHMLCGHE